jgi:hypothetical protein
MRAQGIRPVLDEIRHHLDAAFSSAVRAHEVRRALLKVHRTSEQARKGEQESADPVD